MRNAILAVGTASLFLGGPAWADCSVPHFNFFPNRQVETTMVASSAQSCSIRLRVGALSRFDKVAIVGRPRHGTASAGVGGGVTYTAAAGYAGNDAFVFAVTGKMKSGNGTARIRVTVSVIGDGSAAVSGAVAPRAQRATAPGAKTDAVSAARRACFRQYPGSWDSQRRRWIYYSMRHHYHFIDCLGRQMKGSGS